MGAAQIASIAAATKAIRPRMAALRIGRLTAATVTGVINSRANGLLRPPVSHNSADSCSRSKPSWTVASQRSARRGCGQDRWIHRFTAALRAIRAKQSTSGRWMPKTKCTPSTARLWPATATQRSWTRVRSRRPRRACDQSQGWAPSPCHSGWRGLSESGAGFGELSVIGATGGPHGPDRTNAWRSCATVDEPHAERKR